MTRKILSGLLFSLLWAQSALALDVIQGVARSFVIEAPALDSTDGVTPETALTMPSFTIKYYKKNKAPVTVTAVLAVFASSTLTSTGTNPADGDTFTFTGTLDGTLITEVYRIKDTLAQANDVKREADANTTLDSLKCAINDSGCVDGTDYGTGTIASVLVNATTNTATTQLVVANVPGTLGNSFTTAESSAQLSWTGSTLAGGVDGEIHDANGYIWFCAPGTFWDTLGDGLLTFNYAGVAPFFQKVRVVATRSNQTGVQGLGFSLAELFDYPASSVAAAGSLMKQLKDRVDIAVSAWADELIANHVIADSFGARQARTAVDSRPIVVDAAGLVDANAVKVGPTGSGTAQTAGDIMGDTNDIQARIPAALVSGRMDASVGAMAANTMTAAAAAADLSTEFATTLMATTFEGAHTFKHFLQYGASVLFGKYSKTGNTYNYRDLADTKIRVAALTTPTPQARTSVTLSPD